MGGLEVEGLAVDLGGRRVLQGIDLALPAPTFFGLLGANGSGKTTLLRAVAGRLAPAAGVIRLDGRDVTSDPAARVAGVGFAAPADRLPSRLRGGDVLDLLAAAREADPQAPAGVYAALSVNALRGVRVEAMSSGMRQRLAVFAAFLGRPPVVLLDEPFNWLDPLAAYDLKDAIAETVHGGASVVAALHDVATFVTRCDGGVLLDGGRAAQAYDAADLSRLKGDVGGFEREVYARLRAASTASSASAA